MTSATLRDSLAAHTGTDPRDWFPVFKARYGMLALFRALAAARPDRHDVVTQALTCSTAVDPILVAGLTPDYAEIDPATFAIDPAHLLVPDAAAALVIQHTFGVIDSGASQALAEAARAGGALVVEDSAHCVARMARDEEGSPLADVSIHSLGAEKMLPTKSGGAVWVNPALDAGVREAIVAELTALPAPGPRLAFAARSYRWTRRVVSRVPGGDSVGRGLEKMKLYSPPVAQSEREGRLAHDAVGTNGWIEAEAATALATLPVVEAQRKAATDAYAEALGGPSGQPLLRYPVLVPPGADATEVFLALRAQGIYAGHWYRPALFPGVDDPAAYGYEPGTLPITEDVIARIVNLPTDVSPERARELAAAYLALTS
jgi:dTDP-4-amino-4,6-dideoxygalactose transaminase